MFSRFRFRLGANHLPRGHLAEIGLKPLDQSVLDGAADSGEDIALEIVVAIEAVGIITRKAFNGLFGALDQMTIAVPLKQLVFKHPLGQTAVVLANVVYPVKLLRLHLS